MQPNFEANDTEWHDAIIRQIVWKRPQATVLNIIGKAPCNYLENVISYQRYCDDITIANIIVSERVIFPLTCISRSNASHIQELKMTSEFQAFFPVEITAQKHKSHVLFVL